MAAHNHVMRKFGHSEKKLEDIKSLAGKGAWVMMQRSFKEEIKNEETKKAMTKEFIDFYAKTSIFLKHPPTSLWSRTIFVVLSTTNIVNSLPRRPHMILQSLRDMPCDSNASVPSVLSLDIFLRQKTGASYLKMDSNHISPPHNEVWLTRQFHDFRDASRSIKSSNGCLSGSFR